MSTPALSRCIAVVCRIVWGEIRRLLRLPIVVAVNRTTLCRHCATFARVMASPPRLGSKAELARLAAQMHASGAIEHHVSHLHPDDLRNARPHVVEQAHQQVIAVATGRSPGGTSPFASVKCRGIPLPKLTERTPASSAPSSASSPASFPASCRPSRTTHPSGRLPGGDSCWPADPVMS